MSRAPEHAERAPATGVIPDRRGDDTPRPRHPSHLAEARHRVRHEVDDELGERRVECLVGERQRFGGGFDDGDSR